MHVLRVTAHVYTQQLNFKSPDRAVGPVGQQDVLIITTFVGQTLCDITHMLSEEGAGSSKAAALPITSICHFLCSSKIPKHHNTVQYI